MKSAVLFIIFKRADTTRRVFERIREAQPPRLYIAADGPRKDRPDEVEKCQAARKVVETIDWPCEVHRLYRDENLGCGKGVSSAITWFFEHEEQGVIIEDDVLPHCDFFKYSDEMLVRFKEDREVQLISGNNYFYDGYESEYSYYKSVMMNIWGWASWRRVWETYQFNVCIYPEEIICQRLNERFPKRTALYYLEIYRKMCRMAVDTWDYQFFFNQVFNERYSIAPFINMVQNIGLDSINATHTRGVDHRITGQQSYSPYPLRHPDNNYKNFHADVLAIEMANLKLPSFLGRCLNLVKRCLRKISVIFYSSKIIS